MTWGGPDLLDLLAELEPTAPAAHIQVGEPFTLRVLPGRAYRIHRCTRCGYTCTEPGTAARHQCPPTKG